MAKIDFDQYAGQYEALMAAQTGFFDRDNDYFVRYKVERAKQLAGDADAVLLTSAETIKRMREAKFEIAETGYCLFFPAQLAALRPLEKYLNWLPLGGQYFVAGVRG